MLVTAYHGTDEKTAREILAGGFKAGSREGLWLGKGVYFFQEAPGHALAWAKTVATRPGRSGKATVIKVEIDISNCLDLIDNEHWEVLRLLSESEEFKKIPKQPSFTEYLQSPDLINAGHFQDDFLLTTYITYLNERHNRYPDCIRAIFPEGKPIFENSWLFDQSAIILCVLNPRIIDNISRTDS